MVGLSALAAVHLPAHGRERTVPINLTNAILVATPFADKSANYMRRVFRWDGPSSYVTGGETVNPTNVFGLGTINHINFEVASNGTNILLVRWNFTNKTVQWFDPSTKAEVAAATNLSAYVARGEALGH